MLKKLIIFFGVLMILGCVYKPVSVLTKEIIAQNVYVDVVIKKSDPANSVAIKDGIREAVIKRLNRDLSSQSDADTVIIANIVNVAFAPTSFDRFGFVNAYEAQVSIDYKVKLSSGEPLSIIATGKSYFRMNRQVLDTIYTDSIITNQDRYNAIAEASKESFDELIAKLALKGYKLKKD